MPEKQYDHNQIELKWRAFRDWFVQFDADAWDRQFESDVRGGKSDDLAERALRDHKAGPSTEL